MDSHNRYSRTSMNENCSCTNVTHLFFVLLSIILFFFVSVSVSNAQEAICIPRAIGVPFNSGPPIWWDANGINGFPEYPFEDDRIDDPRWNGSVSLVPLPSSSGATQHVTFRALYFDNALYLSWHVRVMPYMTSDQNLHRLYVGFDPGEGSNPIVIKITPFAASTTALSAAFYHEIKIQEPDGTSWKYWNDPGGGGTPKTPDWLLEPTGNVRVWFDSVDEEWAIHMRIPSTTGSDLDAGIKRTDPFNQYHFKMWFEIGVLIGPPVSGSPDPIAVYKWPPTVNNVTGTAPFYPLPTDWADFCVGTCPTVSGLTCVQGITIAANKIGANPDLAGNPSHKIKLNDPNTFLAKPLNNTISTIPVSTIKATFRIANWGSTALCDDDSDTDPPDCALLWRDIPAAGNGTVVNDAQIMNGNEGNIELPWTLSECERYDFLPDPWPAACNADTDPDRYKKWIHQCLLVELSAPPEQIFENNSVFRNMDFVKTASTFSRNAEISVLGLGANALNRPNRDVYVYIQTLNMPEQIDRPTPGDREPGFEVAEKQSVAGRQQGAVLVGKITDRLTGKSIVSANVIVRGELTHGAVTDIQGNFQIRVPYAGNYSMIASARGYSNFEKEAINLKAGGFTTFNIALQPLPQEELSLDELARKLPAYIVHVYHDTGERPTIDGNENRILHAQSSFGYFVEHEGDLEGWRYDLQLAAESANLDFEQIGPDLYKISIPNDGVAVVTTTIEAIEPSLPLWFIWLLIILLIILIVFIIRYWLKK